MRIDETLIFRIAILKGIILSCFVIFLFGNKAHSSGFMSCEDKKIKDVKECEKACLALKDKFVYQNGKFGCLELANKGVKKKVLSKEFLAKITNELKDEILKFASYKGKILLQAFRPNSEGVIIDGFANELKNIDPLVKEINTKRLLKGAKLVDFKKIEKGKYAPKTHFTITGYWPEETKK